MIRPRKMLLAALIACLAGLAAWAGASAGSRNAVLFFSPSDDFRVGDSISLTALLTTEKGEPLFDQPVDFFLDGVYQETLVTNRSGAVRFSPGGSFEAGSYLVEAAYAGYQFEVPGPASREIVVSPAEILIQTVPTIAGLELLFEGEPLTTGPDGTLRVSVNRSGTYALELLPNADLLSSKQATFAQWFPNDYDYRTDLVVPGADRVQIGFELVSVFSFEFVDPDGSVVDPSRIGAMTIRSSNGIVTSVEPGAPVRLDVNRILARLASLDNATVRHTVESVEVDGAIVVNQGQQRFIHSPGRAIRIELLLYDVRFFGQDVFLGTPNGTGLHLLTPGGEDVYFPLDDQSEIVIPNLARGAYTARVEAENGLGISFPLVLSRSQEVRLPVISYLDVAAGMLLLFGLLVGLPIWGRRRKILAFLLRLLQPDRGLS